MLNEIEIAVITYNRASILEKWMQTMLKQVIGYNMLLSIYDSSSNDDTRILIEHLNEKLPPENQINYVHLDSSIRVDEKVLESILHAKKRYIWPIGDSRVFSLEDLNQKLSAVSNTNVEYISLYDTPSQYNGKVYNDPAIFFHDLFWRSTLLGGLIFDKRIFDALNNDCVRTDYMNKFNRNDGFSYLGIFYHLIATNPVNGIFLTFKFNDAVSSKEPAWIKRYMEVWCDNLCYLVGQLPFDEGLKTSALRTTWKDLRLDGWHWLLKARIHDGLNYSIYKKYKKNGLLKKVSDKGMRIAFVSLLPRYAARFFISGRKFYIIIKEGSRAS